MQSPPPVAQMTVALGTPSSLTQATIDLSTSSLGNSAFGNSAALDAALTQLLEGICADLNACGGANTDPRLTAIIQQIETILAVLQNDRAGGASSTQEAVTAEQVNEPPSSVPEAGTFVMLGLGLATLSMIRKRRAL